MRQDIVGHSVARRRPRVIVRTTSVGEDGILSARAGLRRVAFGWMFA
jgi:hypothetical protein